MYHFVLIFRSFKSIETSVSAFIVVETSTSANVENVMIIANCKSYG